MFRLLLILLTLYFSSAIDGAPHNDLVERGKDISTDNDVKQADLNLGEEDAKGTGPLAFAEEAKAQGDKDIRGTEPSLKPRKLNDSESIGRRSASLTERLSKKAQNVKDCIKTKTSRITKRPRSNRYSGKDSTLDDQGQRARGNKRAHVAPVEDTTKTTDAREDDNNAGASAPKTTSSHELPPEFIQSLKIERETAVGLIKAAGILLMNPNANPYKNKNLAELIDSAFNMYHFTNGLLVPDLGSSDQDSCMAGILAILAELLQELGAKDESKRAFELSSSSTELLSNTSRLGPSPGSYDQQPLDKWDTAIRLVRAVRYLLDQDNADPYQDQQLAQLIDAAIYAYGDAYVRRPLEFLEDDEKSKMDVKMKELREIFEEVEARDEKLTELIVEDQRKNKLDSQSQDADDERSPALINIPSLSKEQKSSFAAMRAPKVEATDAVTAAREALDDPNADPYKDEELAELMSDAIDKYSKAYGRRKLPLQGLAERTQIALKVKQIYSICEEIDEQNASLGNILANMTTQLHRKGHKV